MRLLSRLHMSQHSVPPGSSRQATVCALLPNAGSCLCSNALICRLWYLCLMALCNPSLREHVVSAGDLSICNQQRNFDLIPQRQLGYSVTIQSEFCETYSAHYMKHVHVQLSIYNTLP